MTIASKAVVYVQSTLCEK